MPHFITGATAPDLTKAITCAAPAGSPTAAEKTGVRLCRTELTSSQRTAERRTGTGEKTKGTLIEMRLESAP